MPESKGRRTPKSRVPVEQETKAPAGPSPRWLVPVMLACLILGLLWIVAYYLVPDLPLMSELGKWNMLVGFGLIMIGFGLSTRWR